MGLILLLDLVADDGMDGADGDGDDGEDSNDGNDGDDEWDAGGMANDEEASAISSFIDESDAIRSSEAFHFFVGGFIFVGSICLILSLKFRVHHLVTTLSSRSLALNISKYHLVSSLIFGLQPIGIA